MSICKRKFGIIHGEEIYEYTLENSTGFRARILNLGGIIRTLEYKGVDMVLGFDSAEDYEHNTPYFGAVIGRNSNRIENAEFTLNGNTYKLNANNGKNNLHGGICGFDKKVWSVEEVDGEESTIVLSTFSPDGEEGFPGNADIRVTYTVTSQNALRIHYEAVCDADTVINLTNHTYFNLNGHDSGSIENHTLWLNSSFYTPNSATCVPTGEVLSALDGALDFTSPVTIAHNLSLAHPQTELFSGYDHNFVLNGVGYRKAAVAKGDQSGITMEMYTDRPGVQLYTANGLSGERACKDGAVYTAHGALCLETQAFPNNLKFAHFPTAILKAGEKYDTTTEYRFV